MLCSRLVAGWQLEVGPLEEVGWVGNKRRRRMRRVKGRMEHSKMRGCCTV